jgi:gamma-butyrobetaine dioxygenase
LLRIASASIRADDGFVAVRFRAAAAAALAKNSEEEEAAEEGGLELFPPLYLRDNDVGAFHQSTLQRLRPAALLAPDESAAQLRVLDGGAALWVQWASDGANSTFAAGWLRDHSLRAERRAERRAALGFLDELLPWVRADFPSGGGDGGGGGAFAPPPALCHSYDAVLADDRAALAWLDVLWSRGVSVLRGGPAGRAGAVKAIAERLGTALRATNYGGGTFEVKDKPQPNNQAYTTAALPLHTDLPFYSRPPGVQMLHCVSPSADGVGGRSLLVDGLAVSAALAAESPELHEVLLRTPVAFADDNPGRYYLRAEHTILEQSGGGGGGGGGVVVGVNYNEGVRDSSLDTLPPVEVPQFYAALAAFGRAAHDPANLLELRLAAGDVLVFHNRRVLHGRSAFKAAAGASSGGGGGGGVSNNNSSGGGGGGGGGGSASTSASASASGSASAAEDAPPPPSSRHLQGGYVEWDDVFSFRHVLRHRLARCRGSYDDDQLCTADAVH